MWPSDVGLTGRAPHPVWLVLFFLSVITHPDGHAAAKLRDRAFLVALAGCFASSGCHDAGRHGVVKAADRRWVFVV